MSDEASPRADDPRVDTNARRRRVVVCTLALGCVLLDVTLRVPRDSGRFTALGLLLAATWIAGAFLSGPFPVVPRPWRSPARSMLVAVAIGGMAFLGFLGAFLLVRHLPLVSSALGDLIDKGRAGPSGVVLFVALVTGVAEELFFRGALQSVKTRYRAVVVTTVVYVAVTATTGNVALVVAAAIMGTIFSLERAATGGVAASIATHLTWTTLMLLALPRVN